MPKHIADAIDHLRRADALPESPHRRAEVHVAIRHLLALAAAEIAAERKA